jgi:epoxyqueuosine reductase QueG
MNDPTPGWHQFLEDLFAGSELNRLPESVGGGCIFTAPLCGVARGDDPVFSRYKEVVGPEHLTPWEIWTRSGLEADGDRPEALRVVSIVFPYAPDIRRQSLEARGTPADIYCLARNYANDFIRAVLRQAVDYLNRQGARAVAGVLSRPYQLIVKQDPVRFYSVWSERHAAFAAGLGTFSLHEGFISEKGCNIRLGSVITAAPFAVTPRRSEDPYANCLHYAQGICRECAKRCPAAAISAAGHDKLKCYIQLKEIEKEVNRRLMPILKPDPKRVNGQDMVVYPVGCAFCQFGVPCMDRNPTAAQPAADSTASAPAIGT